MVRGAESVGRVTFALVTSEHTKEPFTVQVCTKELNETGDDPVSDVFATG